MKRRQFIATAAASGAGGVALPLLGAMQMAGPAAAAAPEAAATQDNKPMPIPSSGRSGPATAVTGLTLANLRSPNGPRLAVRLDRGVLDVTAAARALGLKVPQTTDELITNGPGQLQACVDAATKPGSKPGGHDPAAWFVAEDKAPFAPAVVNPQKLICVGLNYRRHAKETGMAVPKAPILFNKFNNTLNHHGGIVPIKGLPGDHFDYEVELVIVMGRRCVDVDEAHALDYVFGYCTGNDFSERISQQITSQWLAGKSSDGFAPLGPWLLTADLVGNPNALQLTTHVNGEQRQNSNTSDLIFNCQQIISYASKVFPLEPGDIIYTGTPEGVVLGMPKDKQVWLKSGDKVVTTVEKLGALEITVG